MNKDLLYVDIQWVYKILFYNTEVVEFFAVPATHTPDVS